MNELNENTLSDIAGGDNLSAYSTSSAPSAAYLAVLLTLLAIPHPSHLSD